MYSSGVIVCHGSKADPEMVQAAASALGVPIHRCAMIGDSAADLPAGKRAGLKCAILVGKAKKVEQYADLANV